MHHRDQDPVNEGHVFWLFGLSGAGKTTLAAALTRALRDQGLPVLCLDGDRLRAGLCQGLGFSGADRAENLRRAAEVAKLAVESGIIVVASFISPFESNRHAAAQIIGRGALSYVYLNASLEACRSRDCKGLYARAATGQLHGMAGISYAFEAPSQVDLTVPSGLEAPDQSASALIAFAMRRLRSRGSVAPLPSAAS